MPKVPAPKPLKISPALKSALAHLESLLQIPAATNRIGDVADYVETYAKKIAKTYPLIIERQADDTIFIKIKGKSSTKDIAYGGHLDRIGLMVDELMADGSVRFSAIGGLYPAHMMDGVTASIEATNGTYIEGVIAHLDSPVHSFTSLAALEKRPQKFEKLRLRPDACIGATKENGKKMLEGMGIQVGNLIWLNQSFKLDHKNQIFRSRWLDNSLGCVTLLGLLDDWAKNKVKPAYDTALIFSAAEEAGMGGTSVIYPELTDFISVDVAVAEDMADINVAVIMQKAGRLPYSHTLVKELEAAAEKAKAPFVRKVNKGGGTDAEQARGAGFKGRIANIDIPIYGMHSIESATFKGLDAVINTLNIHAQTK